MFCFKPTGEVMVVSKSVEESGQAIGQQLHDLTAEQLTLAAKHLARLDEDIHRGVHEARKSMRRARAVLALGRKTLGRQARHLSEAIGRLGRGLSPLRDAQALVETLERLSRKEAALDAVIPQAIDAAKQRRTQVLAGVLARDPGMQSRQRRILAFVRQLAALRWHRVTINSIDKSLERSRKRADKAEAAAQRSQEAEVWHTLRRKVRRVRQQYGMLDEIAPHLQELPGHQELAECLGESQDDALLLARCGTRSPFAPAERAILRRFAKERLAAIRAPKRKGGNGKAGSTQEGS